MKSKILAALRENRRYVSGQELCERFGVTRTAIWKSINQLKEDGYSIEAVQNKGYRIVGFPDSISSVEITSLMETVWAGRELKFVETVDSTNNYARKLAENDGVHGTLVVAEKQEMGKGRRGKVWSTPKGTSVAMTLILRPELEPQKASMLTLVMGITVAKAINRMLGLDCKIKWPNDVVINGKKICGILTEMSADMDGINYLVVGAGINVNLDILPEEIIEIATSLSLETGHPVHRAEVICQCMKTFEEYYGKFMETKDLSLMLDDYNDILINNGKAVKVMEPGNEYTGVSTGINELGELQVIKDTGEKVSIFAGEVSVRGIYGYV